MADRHEPNEGYFPVTFVHRDDIIQALVEEGNVTTAEARARVKTLTDDDMKIIADKMGDAYVSNGYWSDLQFIAEDVLSDKMMRG